LRLVLLFVLVALALLVVVLALVLGFVGLGRPTVGVGVNVILPVLGCFAILECLHERVLVVDGFVLGGAIEA
jgi:hypothetical protein